MPLCNNKRMDPSKFELSFAGCGFLCIYHAGVCAAIKEYAPQLTQNRILGSSAGAIAAAGLICNICMSYATSTILQCVTEARAGSLQALSLNFDILRLVREGLEESLPPDAHILCTGRLFISATRARDYANVLISEFDSREELIQAILCSCFIPFYCGRTPPSYRGEQYIDGGFSDNQPGKWEMGTVTVSPFSGESDICPMDEDSASLFGFDFCGTSVQFTTQNLFRMIVILFPPSPEVCSRICRQGFEDALRFLTKNHLVPCVKCLTVQSNAIPIPTTTAAKSQRLRDIQKRRRALTVPSSANNLLHECERCMEPLDNLEMPRFSAVPLPSVVQKTLADMEARASASLLNWLRRWRLIRWWLRLVLPPVLLPFELLQFVLRKMRNWLKQTALAPTEAYLLRFQHFIDFLLTEVENRRLLLQNGSAADAIPSAPVGVFRSALLPIGPLSALHLTTVEGGEKTAANDIPSARKISICQQRKMSTSVAPLDLAIPIGQQMMAEEDEEGRKGGEGEEERKMEKAEKTRVLQEFCERHEAVLAFHYRDDETNELKICQIFDTNGLRPRQQCHTECPMEYPEHEGSQQEETTEDAGKTTAAEDSGLSLEEEEGGNSQERRNSQRFVKKAEPNGVAHSYSSPSGGRHFANQQQQNTRTINNGTRRHTFSTRPAPSASRLSASTRTLASPARFVTSGTRLYASNSMNALKMEGAKGKGGAAQIRRKISVQTVAGETDSEKEEEGMEGRLGRQQQMIQRKLSNRRRQTAENAGAGKH